jgi:hypothetical protein
MFKKHPQYDGSSWSFTMQRIGEALRDRYDSPEELPRELLALIDRIDEQSEALVDAKSATARTKSHD